MAVRFPVYVSLFVFALNVFAAPPVEAQIETSPERAYERRAYIAEEVDGTVSCRTATQAEAVTIASTPPGPLRVFGEPEGSVRASGVRLFANLNIILRGTAQLDASPQAKAAFERAAQIWESRIRNAVTVYVDVDYGATRFGAPFDAGVLATHVTSLYVGTSEYSPLRDLLRARADNGAETMLYNALPASSLPTDLGSTSDVLFSSILARALGAVPAAATSTELAPSVGVNSAFAYDFDPSDGISPGTTDFEALAVHEIGHMLGFTSGVGSVELGRTFPYPSILDWFRFRPGVTSGSFIRAQRIQSSGGEQVYFAGAASLALSTGRADGTGGDGRQADHWKDELLTGGTRIGLMSPFLLPGVRGELTENDLGAFDVMGYNIVNAPVSPSNLTGTATSPTSIRLQWTDNSSNETEFRVEQKNASGTFVDIGSVLANATTLEAGGFTPGQIGIFRVRARNGSGNSGYANEASATTPGPGNGACAPSSTTVCLLNGRFQVSIAYVNPFSSPPNQPGTFLAARLLQGVQNPDTALFGFASAQAVEVVVRIQDTRPFAPRFDLYYGGMTDVGYTVTVTDTVTGVTRQYTNTVGRVGGGVDRSSFPAGALGWEDRMLSSGGRDRFYDEIPGASSGIEPNDPVFQTGTLTLGTPRTGTPAPSGVKTHAVPAAPSNLTATATSSSMIVLHWQDNSSDEDEFRIEAKPGSGVTFSDLGAAPANSTSVDVTGVSPGTTVVFRIRARNASGDSGYSNEATATTFAVCVANSTTVCLLSKRFRVKIDYVNPFSNPPNQPGTFLAARLLPRAENPDTALFGFSSAQAVEVVVRVQDTRPFAQRFDIYYGGMTDVGYTVTVTDTQTGTTRQYTNAVGTVGGGVDRNSFPVAVTTPPQ